jgi:hypothetical protein
MIHHLDHSHVIYLDHLLSIKIKFLAGRGGGTDLQKEAKTSSRSDKGILLVMKRSVGNLNKNKSTGTF